MNAGKFGCCLVLLLGTWAAAFPAERTVDISGRVKLFTTAFLQNNQSGTFFAHKAGDFGMKRLETRLKLSGSVNDRLSFDLRFDAFSYSGDLITRDSFPESGFLGSPLFSEYGEWNIYEAKVKVSGFLLKNLDLTVGKQRIAWGTADKIGVLDNLNPIDFANFFTFDPDYFAERRPQTALNFEYYFGTRAKLQFVWLLQSQVSPMPYGYASLAGKFFHLSAFTVDKAWDNSIRGTNYGARLSGKALNMDIALSYYHGNSPLPVLTGLAVSTRMQGHFFYPKMAVLGLDLSGEFKGIGFWGEAAWIMPEKTAGRLSMLLINDLTPLVFENAFPMFESGFGKYVFGLDYSFGAGFYANCQFLHGFFDEFDYSARGQDSFSLRKGMFFGEISDYILSRLEYKTANEGFRAKAGFLYEIAGDAASLTLLPEVEFRVADSLIIQAGAFTVVSGDQTRTKFGLFKKDKTAYLSLKLDF